MDMPIANNHVSFCSMVKPKRNTLTSKDDTAKRQHLVLLSQRPVRFLRQEVLGQEIDKRCIEEKAGRARNR